MIGWQKFAEEAAALDGDLVEQVATAALTRWAVAPAVGATKVARELACASLVGARLVDAAIEKLACDAEEREFLRALNAEAGVRDLAVITKRAFTDDPRLIGAGLGAVAGAGFGAWKHEDDRLTGAAAYAVPGAALGYIGGSLVGENAAVTRAQAAHAQAEAAQAQAAQHAAAQERNVANAASRLELKRRADEAERWHRSLQDMTAVLSEKADPVKQPGLREFARKLLPDLAVRRDDIVAHAFTNPGKAHPDLVRDHYDNLPLLQQIYKATEGFHKLGPG